MSIYIDGASYHTQNIILQLTDIKFCFEYFIIVLFVVQCPWPWILFEGSCYKYFSATPTSNWHNAKLQCEAEDASLVTISSEFENDFVRNLRDVKGDSCKPTWIGLNDINVETTFEWASNEPKVFSGNIIHTLKHNCIYY